MREVERLSNGWSLRILVAITALAGIGMANARAEFNLAYGEVSAGAAVADSEDYVVQQNMRVQGTQAGTQRSANYVIVNAIGAGGTTEVESAACGWTMYE